MAPVFEAFFNSDADVALLGEDVGVITADPDVSVDGVGPVKVESGKAAAGGN